LDIERRVEQGWSFDLREVGEELLLRENGMKFLGKEDVRLEVVPELVEGIDVFK